MSTLLIQESQDIREYAVLENDKSLVRYFKEDISSVSSLPEAEQIYLARVDRIMSGTQNAYVSLAGDITGYLPFNECKAPPRSGDMIQVQIKKPPFGNKAAYVTQDISIAGKLVILLPCSLKKTVSSRIEDDSDRSRLLRLADELCPDGMGIIMRSESVSADTESIRQELDELMERLQEINEKARTMTDAGLLSGRLQPLDRILRDEKNISQIVTNGDSTFALPFTRVDDPFTLYNVRDKLERRLRRSIWLPCGGYITVDICEAMTVIDVNSGKYTGIRHERELFIRKLNQQAAEEISAVMRLRNLSGIIIIDFVDMQTDEARQAVIDTMKKCIQVDPVKCVIHGFTTLGLLEVTRKRTSTILSSPEDRK